MHFILFYFNNKINKYNSGVGKFYLYGLVSPARIRTRRWRVRVLLVPNTSTVADLPPDSGLLGGGLRGGITSTVGRTVEYPPNKSN
ncbi:hypothetical protein Hanom_Chr16g01519541 [Helianthus anomalus]